LIFFGVFGYSNVFEKRVFGVERRAKFLLCKRFVPENFNGLILGPSLSGNLDPNEHQPLQVYNGSIRGGGIAILQRFYSTMKAGRAKFDVVLICLNPYLLNADDSEERVVWDQTHRSVFGSYNLLVYYMYAAVRISGIAPNRFPYDAFEVNGKNNFEKDFLVSNVD
jgi:hypothetical protein